MENRHEINQTIEYLKSPQPIVIGLEGGPCGGKTTILNELRGMHNPQVELLSEVATKKIAELKELGKTVIDLSLTDRDEYLSFQSDILREIVSTIDEAKRIHQGTAKIIVSDRVDIGAYVSTAEYRKIVENLGLRAAPYLTLTDKIIYLPTLAKLDPSKFNLLLGNNASRYEQTTDQAIATCDNNLLSIADHPEFFIYDSTNLKDKIDKIKNELVNPESEVEAKFIPEDTANQAAILRFLKQRCSTFLSKIAISQSYHSWNSIEYRLRQIKTDRGDIAYYFSIKSGKGAYRLEKRRIIDQKTYQLLSKHQPLGALSKTRYRYLFAARPDSKVTTVLAADFYDGKGLCLLEAEGINPEQSNDVYLPGFKHTNLSARDLI